MSTPILSSADDAGLTFASGANALITVRFDDRRIWSLWVARDGRATPQGWFVPWPERLVPLLQGTTQLSLVHSSDSGDTVIHDAEHSFGTEDRRLAVVDRQGAPLAVDNDGRLVKTFETKDGHEFEALLDALQTVLDLLRGAGVEAFPAYGTLLGAVRQGAFIGYDNDADTGYVSRCTHPLDVTLESFRLQRAVQQQGYATSRYSGASFKIDVPDADGSSRGLDVFAGFFHEGDLALMGDVWAPYEPEWVFPLGTVELEGRTLPAPAVPEKLLEAAYGPTWRVPDPAFHFEKDPDAQRRFDLWFRGSRVNRAHWDHRFGLSRLKPPYPHPQTLTQHVHRLEDPDTWVLDVGCGRGRDGRWLARQGRRAIGIDYASVAMDFVRDKARELELPLELHTVNLLELRPTLAWAALLAREPGPRAIMARHFLDATTPVGRDNFWRFAEIVLRGAPDPTQGRVYAEFVVAPIEDPQGRTPFCLPLDVDDVIAQAESRGFEAVDSVELIGEPIDYGYGEEDTEELELRSCRLTLQRKRSAR